jgi:NAD(P)-dependent dehydrogenase (short-subunit alcohol dehydrogenase family)
MSFPENGWDKVMDLNVKTPFFLTQKLHDALKRGAAKGHLAKVINIASIDGVSVNQQETYSYAASKAGLIHLTKRMALRLITRQHCRHARSRRAPSPQT